mmetsp:Transcript_143539/g.357697  ORF Transcript_143539/g.357697 Transcript_143539/m.357697 type:complete len:212 (+) Transcript_143539:813-1448(+)
MSWMLLWVSMSGRRRRSCGPGSGTRSTSSSLRRRDSATGSLHRFGVGEWKQRTRPLRHLLLRWCPSRSRSRKRRTKRSKTTSKTRAFLWRACSRGRRLRTLATSSTVNCRGSAQMNFHGIRTMMSRIGRPPRAPGELATKTPNPCSAPSPPPPAIRAGARPRASSGRGPRMPWLPSPSLRAHVSMKSCTRSRRSTKKTNCKCLLSMRPPSR